MKSKLTEIFEKYCGKMDFFTNDVDFSDKLSSLLMIEMITDIEEQFEIDFEMDDLKQEIVTNPTNLLKLIEQKKNK